MVEKKTERKIKTVRSDNGTEYINHHLEYFLKQEGIKHELTVEYTPQQNGVAERKNRTLEGNGTVHDDPVWTSRKFLGGSSSNSESHLKQMLFTKSQRRNSVQNMDRKDFSCQLFSNIWNNGVYAR
ncbi:integrase core domain [Lasius niger]|uniref:Integrase core domain n=1 Tax=Lasius niger TaxID=67767 RepID=A0A0J7KEL0_LASNI|nr:integrase core domain [Lasius niger]